MKLQIDDRTITDREELAHAWENHFSSLSKSRITDTCEVQALQREIMSLTTASRSHEDYVFDVEFDVEEVSKAISKLPNRKATGPDGVSSEHLKFGVSLLRTWITQIFSAILLLECRLEIIMALFLLLFYSLMLIFCCYNSYGLLLLFPNYAQKTSSKITYNSVIYLVLYCNMKKH